MSAITSSSDQHDLAAALCRISHDQTCAHVATMALTQGICTVQAVTRGDQGWSVTTRLLHTSGQWLETVCDAAPDQSSADVCLHALHLLVALRSPPAPTVPILTPSDSSRLTPSASDQAAPTPHAPVDPDQDPTNATPPPDHSSTSTSHTDDEPNTSVNDDTSSSEPTSDTDQSTITATTTPIRTPSSGELPYADKNAVELISAVRAQANGMIDRALSTAEELSSEMNLALGADPQGRPDLDRLTRSEAITVLLALHACEARLSTASA